MNGLGITIIVGQLPKLFGFSTDGDGFVDELRAFFPGLDETNAATARRRPRRAGRAAGPAPADPDGPRRPGRPSSARPWSRRRSGSPRRASATVGALPQGLPTPSLPWTQLSDVGPLLIAAIGITLVSLTDTIATATSFAARRGDEVEPDQEMIGMGVANIAAGSSRGSPSRPAARAPRWPSSRRQEPDDRAGRRRTGAVLLLFLNSLLADLPQTALAAVVIAAALSLDGPPGAARYRRVRRSAFALSLVATCGVSSSACSGDRDRHRAGHPVVLPPQLVAPRRRARQRSWRGGTPSTGDPEARQLPGMVVFRWEAPLFFANAGAFPSGPPPGPGKHATLGRAAVRGGHRHRRHGGRDAPSSSTWS